MFFKVAEEGIHETWAYLVTILSVVFAFFLGQIPLGVAVARAGDPTAFLEELDLSALGLDPNLVLTLFLLPFLTAFVVLYLLVRTVHQRSFRTVVTARSRTDWGRVFFAFGTALLISGLIDGALYWQDPGNYVWRFDAGRFFPLLLIALVFLPLQTSCEELFFRGYLLQGIGLRVGNRWAPLLLTSLFFGLVHSSNPEMEAFSASVMLPFYIGFGLVLGVCTLLDEGTETALGFHAANNFYGATVVSFPGSALQTPSLWRLQNLDAALILPAFLAGSVLFLAVMAWRYGWRDWEKLLRPV